MFRVGLKAAFVFCFMAFLSAEAATGFMRTLFAGGVYPRAMRAFDWMLKTFFTDPLGQTGGAIALLGLGLLFAILVWRREAGSERQSATPKHQPANEEQTIADGELEARGFGRKMQRDEGHRIWSDAGARAWISRAFREDGMSRKRGTRTKFHSHDWEPATYEIPVEPDEVHAAFRRHWRGDALQRADFPEALAVFDQKRFALERDLFMAGPFAAVKGKLANLLSRFDFGEGGLIPLTIYEADLVTPFPGEFFLLNFGARKNSLLPEQSSNVVKSFVVRATGFQYWKINSGHEDGDVALSTDALGGPDLWFEEKVTNDLFVSDALAQALREAGMADVFKLKRCRVLQRD
jgi:hypothetical protein